MQSKFKTFQRTLRQTSTTLFAAGLVSFAVLPGCTNDDEQPSEQLEDSLDNATDAIEEMRDASSALEEEINSRREQLQQITEMQMFLIDTQIEEYQDAISNFPASEEPGLREQLDRLVAQRAQVEKALIAFINAAPSSGDEARESLSDALEEMDEAFEEFAEELKDRRVNV